MAQTKATAVIGAGWGDEGKGRLVDALSHASSETPVVVRFNGGAQAGHTVTLNDGRRHVFHHVGAGALAGAHTHLSRHFVHHPMVLQAERASVSQLGGSVAISADPRGGVTTPWDMLINQVVEQRRGSGRHGSCGLGFGETIERNLAPGFSLTVADLTRSDLASRLDHIRRAWVPMRLAALGVANLSPHDAAILANDEVAAVFQMDCQAFADTVEMVSDATLGRHGRLIFEGAQGIELDQTIGTFPHVTRSNTGLVNVLDIAREADVAAIEAVYITRSYATRHGSGPLDGGAEHLAGFRVRDETNVPNPWQGAMRYAPLDLGRLDRAIAADAHISDAGPIQVQRKIFMTCLDQVIDLAPLRQANEMLEVAPERLAAQVATGLGLQLLGQSWGPERAQVYLSDASTSAA